MVKTNNRMFFMTLVMMISFASVNAVLFTPALPQISHYFSISDVVAQHTISWFLVGYAIGQLFYGPVSSRFGRKKALYVGIGVQIVSSLMCALAGYVHAFWLLMLGRFLLALGSGVGLKMTFTYINSCFTPRDAAAVTSYLALSFAVTPGLSVALGGYISTHASWMACFYAGAIYGIILLLMCTTLPETQEQLNKYALKLNHLIKDYLEQFKNVNLLAGGVLVGICTCFVYVFAALAPFVVINLMGFDTSEYGLANLLPPIGLILGSVTSAKMAKKMPLVTTIRTGAVITGIGVIMMLGFVVLQLPVLLSIFVPVIVVYFGLSLIMANASVIAMNGVIDKSHGSAVMSFINMGFTTVIVLSLGYLPIREIILPMVFLALTMLLFILSFVWLSRSMGEI